LRGLRHEWQQQLPMRPDQ